MVIASNAAQLVILDPGDAPERNDWTTEHAWTTARLARLKSSFVPMIASDGDPRFFGVFSRW